MRGILPLQVVELLATDYLASSLPKEYVAKALDVVAKFAQQVGGRRRRGGWHSMGL